MLLLMLGRLVLALRVLACSLCEEERLTTSSSKNVHRGRSGRDGDSPNQWSK